MEKAPFQFLLEYLGVDRTENLLFNCKPDLKGKVQEVRAIRKNCIKCFKPNISAWEFKQDGILKQYFASDVCSGCMRVQDTQKYTSEIADMRRRSIENNWYNIGENDQSGFKNYIPTNKVTEEALKRAKNYTSKLLDGELSFNLLMFGNPGTGKTHLAKTIAKTAKVKGYSVAFINAVEMFNLLKKTFGNVRHNGLFYQEYTDFDLVVVDDIGLETKKLSEISWSVTEWTRLVDARQGKATVYTTNFDDEKISDVVGPRAKSRMYQNSIFIDLFTDDYRKNLRIM